MNQKPVFLTYYALVRLLKEMLVDMGLSDTKADVLAQVHMQQSLIPTHWSDFLSMNCSSCNHSPESCIFLNPTEEQCRGSATPDTLRAAQATMIESGRRQRCPLYEEAP